MVLMPCCADAVVQGQADRVNYLMTRQAKVVAMTCTHAALKRRDFLDLAFKYDNLLLEEAAQILEIETFLPMLLQVGSFLVPLGVQYVLTMRSGPHAVDRHALRRQVPKLFFPLQVPLESAACCLHRSDGLLSVCASRQPLKSLLQLGGRLTNQHELLHSSHAPRVVQRPEGGHSRLKRVTLIGDHHQLPPVVKNMAFQKYSHLDQSLFTRFVRLGTPYLELNAQVCGMPPPSARPRCQPGLAPEAYVKCYAYMPS